jgi:hypothetical protein
MNAPHGRGWVHYVTGVLLNVVLFGAIGPLIGALVFFVLMFAWAASPSTPLYGAVAGPALLVAMLPFVIVFAYAKGGLAAATTGALTAVASSWLSGSTLYGIAAAAGGALSVFFLWLEDRTLAQDHSLAVILFLTGLFAALVCARIARPLRLGIAECGTARHSVPAE